MSQASTADAPLPVTVIEPRTGWIPVDLKEVWRYRELLYFFVWRDVKVRYKQTLLGAAWAILQPFMTMVVFTIFFGRMAKIDSGGFPYPIFSYAGLLPWTLFASGLTQGSNSLVGAQNMLKKVYFPRLLLPLASVGAPLVDFCLAFLVYLGLMAWFGVSPSWRMLALPLLVALAVTTSLGVSLWLSAINVRFRDVRYVVPFFIQLWLFATPVIYPTAKMTSFLREHHVPGWLFGLNPMAGPVAAFRWAVLGGESNLLSVLLVSFTVTLTLLISGAYFFRRTEQSFADIV